MTRSALTSDEAARAGSACSPTGANRGWARGGPGVTRLWTYDRAGRVVSALRRCGFGASQAVARGSSPVPSHDARGRAPVVRRCTPDVCRFCRESLTWNGTRRHSAVDTFDQIYYHFGYNAAVRPGRRFLPGFLAGPRRARRANTAGGRENPAIPPGAKMRPFRSNRAMSPGVARRQVYLCPSAQQHWTHWRAWHYNLLNSHRSP